MEQYNETQLLRMTKDELIEHILDTYSIRKVHLNWLAQWYDASEKIQELRDKQGLSQD